MSNLPVYIDPHDEHLPSLFFNEVKVIACPHPFKTQRIISTIAHGMTIAEMIHHLQPDSGLAQRAHVYIYDHYIPPEDWDIVPISGTVITIKIVPGIFLAAIAISIIAAISASAVSAFIGGTLGTILGAIVGLGISILGTLLMKALIPPPNQKLGRISGTGDTTEKSQVYSITGSQNQANLYGPIPKIFGRHRMAPPYGAAPYTDLVGNSQYLRLLFIWGYGPLQIEDIKIGETPIEQFSGVEIETRNGYAEDLPVTLYTGQIRQEDFSLLLNLGNAVIRTTKEHCDEVSVDITFPKGLMGIDNTQTTNIYATAWPHQWWIHVTVAVLYRKVGTSTWYQGGSATGSGNTTSVVRAGCTFALPENGQYEIACVRQTSKASADSLDDTYWTALRSITHGSPVSFPIPVAMTAIRILATDQLHGVIDNLNAVVTSICPDWDTATQTWITRATQNPASFFRDTLTCTANARPVATARLDLQTLQDWHEINETAGRKFNFVVDTQSTVIETLKDICAAGRATPNINDGLWSVVLDQAQTVPIQHFSDRNSWGFNGEKKFIEMPHGFRCRFINENNDWQQDERIVLDDGYQMDGYDAFGNYSPALTAASKFESLEMIGITDPDQVWKIGRYHLAVAKLRPETYTFYTDFEHLVATRGDLIRMSHDVTLWGGGWGRVKSIATSGGYVTGVTLDEFMEMAEGLAYNVRFRLSDGTSLLANVTNVFPGSKTLTLATPVLEADGPEVGDLAMFGLIEEESAELLIYAIEPQSDLAAKITAVDYNPGVYTADTGTIPPFESHLSFPMEWLPPIIYDIRSDVTVIVLTPTGWQPRILVTFNKPQGLNCGAVGLEADYWITGTDNPHTLVSLTSIDSGEVSLLPVTTGADYSIRLRWVYTDQRTRSRWSDIAYHTVVGLTNIPNVTSLNSVYRDNRLWLVWNPIRSIYPGISYEIRKGATWATAAIVGDTVLAEFMCQGDDTYWVISKIGSSYSTTPASIVIEGSNAIGNILVSVDEATAGWTGGLTQAEVISDCVQLTASTSGDFGWFAGDGWFGESGWFGWFGGIEGSGFNSPGYYATAEANVVDLGEPQQCYLTVSYLWDAIDPYGDIDSIEDWDSIVSVDGEVIAYVRVDPQVAVAGNDGVFGDWLDFFQGMYYGRYFKFRLKLSTTNVLITPRVLSFIWTVDMPDRIETDSDSVSNGGTTITYSKEFHMTPNPLVTILNASAGDDAVLTSLASTGFHVQVLNGGSGVARTVHWLAKGY